MRKEYSINELAQILGCSRTAIVKKIKPDGDNPGVERYKNRYDVVISNGIKAILLDENELEQEKACSRGFKTVTNNGVNQVESEAVNDVEPKKDKNVSSELYNFTERYIDNLKTLHQHMYNEVLERDKKILLLSTSEETQKKEYLKISSENVALKKRNTMLVVMLGVVSIVLICFITFGITYAVLHKTVAEPVDTIEEVMTQKKDHAQQEVPENPKQPVKHGGVTK